MATSHIARAKKMKNARPGATSSVAKKISLWTLLAFTVIALIATGLLFAEISTPGMAWYTWE